MRFSPFHHFHRYFRQEAGRLTPPDRAVSSVVGVILMVSVTVILASVVATFAFSFDFEHVRPIVREILDGDLVVRP